MNPYYIIGVIATSILVYAILVAAVTLTGVSIGIAMIVVYAIMLCCMFSMQKRARQAYMPQTERRRPSSVASSTVGASMAASITSPIRLGRLAEQQAANQESSATSIVGAVDAR